MTSPRETIISEYHYDPLDRLIGHGLPEVAKRQRFYCKSRLATEIQGVMRYSIVQHGDQLLAQQRNEGDTPDTTLLATDQQRSVLQTVKTDHPPQPIVYSPYGHRPVESGLLSLLGFNGERPDPVTGCYLLGNGYRAFNPVLMRFNSPDSLSPFGKGWLNAYAYCGGEPVLWSDPTGHFKIPNVWKGLKNLLGRTPRQYRSGLERVFSRIVKETENTVMPDGSWRERTTKINQLGTRTQTRYVTGNGRSVVVSSGDAPSKTYKQNPSLQELSYSKMSGADIKELYSWGLPEMDLAIDRSNIVNAAEEITPQLMNTQGLSKGYASIEAMQIAFERGVNGELMGVHPTKAKIIRDEWWNSM